MALAPIRTIPLLCTSCAIAAISPFLPLPFPCRSGRSIWLGHFSTWSWVYLWGRYHGLPLALPDISATALSLCYAIPIAQVHLSSHLLTILITLGNVQTDEWSKTGCKGTPVSDRGVCLCLCLCVCVCVCARVPACVYVNEGGSE